MAFEKVYRTNINISLKTDLCRFNCCVGPSSHFGICLLHRFFCGLKFGFLWLQIQIFLTSDVDFPSSVVMLASSVVRLLRAELSTTLCAADAHPGPRGPCQPKAPNRPPPLQARLKMLSPLPQNTTVPDTRPNRNQNSVFQQLKHTVGCQLRPNSFFLRITRPVALLTWPAALGEES